MSSLAKVVDRHRPSLTTNDLTHFSTFLNTVQHAPLSARGNLLSSLPLTESPSYAPLDLFSTLLAKQPGTWPVFDLILAHSEVWKHLPEDAKAGRQTPYDALLQKSLLQIKLSYNSLLDLFTATSEAPAIFDPQSRQSLAHRRLYDVVKEFRLPVHPQPGSRKPVVAVALPNGPLLGIAVLAVATYYTAAPVNAAVGVEQFKADILQSGASVVLVVRSDVQKLQLKDAWLAEAGVQVLIADLAGDMTMRISDIKDLPVPAAQSHTPNKADDIGILLFTSGTSGTKKLVPITIHSIVSGVAFVIDSWGLTSKDCCLNMMPLNHVGGIVRNLFAPIMVGGSTICCSAFDPNLFVDILEDLSPTWYYASPTMHSAILDAVADRPEVLARSNMRLVCNAAGGLLPSLAIRIRDTFNCIVLPSYGMTEAMPIASPPLNYTLDRPGTSGRSVGPEIAVLDGNDKPAALGVVGQIYVRGAPVFHGYLQKDGKVDKSAFNADGWFGTGDMGYLDAQGYLYITGRSEEVINRGGELISPFEVEEAIVKAAAAEDSLLFGRVSQALAFSAPHDVLQEVVGVVLVTPPGVPRADLRPLQSALKSSLHSVKVPVVCVYMDNVPKNNNKVLRIKLAERLNLATLTDNILLADRHFDAVCPAPNTALSVPIPCTPCMVDCGAVGKAVADLVPQHISAYAKRSAHDGFPEVYLAPQDGTAPLSSDYLEPLKLNLRETLDGNLLPEHIHFLNEPFPTVFGGYVDEARLEQLTRMKESSASMGLMSPTARKVSVAMASVLGADQTNISSTSDFFELGGDSLRAGKLLALLRKDFQLRLPVDLLFNHSQVEQLSALIDEKLGSSATTSTSKEEKAQPAAPLPGVRRTCSSTNAFLMAVQLLPIMLFYPLKRALTWTIWMYILTGTQVWATNESMPGRLFNLIFSLGAARAIASMIAPIGAILFKWVVIGVHEEGLYAMWNAYHTKWWLVHKVVTISGMGVFRHFNWSRVLYYRLLGATIGRNVTISPHATLGEWDLIELGDDVNLDACICRPFGAERNTSMYLGQIVLGRNCHVGLKSIVAPGATLPDDTSIGPNSSSWEAGDSNEDSRNLSSSKIEGPHWAFTPLIIFIQLLVQFFGAIPWMCGLVGLVKDQAISEAAKSRGVDYIVVILHWFSTPKRLAYHYFACVLNASLGPIFTFAIVLLIKRILDVTIGPLVPGPAYRQSQLQKLRKAIMNNIMSNGKLHNLTELFGQHYEVTSIAIRLLGGKVGQRVYWPGTGPTIGDYDLIDIGDDVVFGSRAHLITSDGNGSEVIRVGNNAMVADRVVLLPGVTLGDRCTFGSGGMTTRGTSYAPDTTWVGSKNGEAICLSQGTGQTSSQVTMMPSAPPTPMAVKEEKKSFFSMTRSLSNFDIEMQPPSGITTMVNSRYNSTDNLHTPQLSSHNKKSFLRRGRPLSSHSTLMKSATATLSPLQSPTETTTALPSPPITPTTPTTPSTTQQHSPFGRAFYGKQAPYYVYPLWLIIAYSLTIQIVTALYWNIATTTSVVLVSHLLEPLSLFASAFWYRPLTIFSAFTLFISALASLQAVIALGLVVAAKWTLIGKRKVGSYDWDQSSYCQRWQLFLTIEKLRRQCYGGYGILGLLTGSHYMTMYFRALGANIGANCALFAGGLPSLMFTEPDLLTLGDRVVVDDASLVGHINSRGNFRLNELRVGERSVLRSGSRLLSGAEMGVESCLLEHTLVMAGGVVEEGMTMQGWPADGGFTGKRVVL